MDTVQVLGSAMGLGLLAGIRLYATVFALGLAIRMGWFQLSDSFQHLAVLSHTPVLVVSGIALAVEFLADKIPWLDSLWDSVHTVVRPIGGTALAALALGEFDPTMQTLLALFCGGIAFTGHTSKAATRLVANHSPEPFSNVILSLTEDLMTPVGIWLVLQHPEVAIAIVSIFLAIFAWLSPKIFRLLNVSWTAFVSLTRRIFAAGPEAASAIPIPAHITGTLRRALEEMPVRDLPPDYARKLNAKTAVGIHCVATRSIRTLKTSTGYLCATPDHLVFIARRMFRLRSQSWTWAELQEAGLYRGIFLDSLVLQTSGKEITFDVFKNRKPALRPGLDTLWQSR